MTKLFELKPDYSANQKLHNLQKQAFDKLQSIGFPHKKTEDWKYTPIKELESLDLEDAKASSIQSTTEINSKIIFNNGILVKSVNLPQGVTFQELHAELEEFDSINKWQNPFALQNLGQCKKTYLLKVQNNTQTKEAISLEFLNSGEGEIAFCRVYIIAEENSYLPIIEVHENHGENNLFNLVKEIKVSTNAQVHLGEIVSAKKNRSLTHTISEVNRDGVFNHFHMALGSDLQRNEVESHLLGTGAHTELHGLYTLEGSDHSAHKTLIRHHKEHTTSEQLYKGVLQDDSHAVFDGQVIVDKNAQKITSEQLNNNLMLGEKAKIDSKPQLLIEADDVKCAHGTTTGQIEKDSLFYLQSRGFSKIKSKSILANAFAFAVIDRIENESIKKFANRVLEKEIQERDF